MRPIDGFLSGVWSATPTPLTEDLVVDVPSVERMVEHHVRLGVKGLFLGGTCGEGAWMSDRELSRLVQAVSRCARGRLCIAVQVTDNSVARILDNMGRACDDGADIAVIAPPYFLLNANEHTLANCYLKAIRSSPLPVGIYDRGKAGAVVVPEAVLEAAYLEEHVVVVKDSSTLVEHRDLALAARGKRPALRLFTGWEFKCVDYLRAGYDGLLLGGAVFNGYLANQILQAAQRKDYVLADQLQERMNHIMYAVYGGAQVTCWLSGLKKLLVEMGIFATWRNILDYPLTESCVQEIERTLREDADVLLP